MRGHVQRCSLHPTASASCPAGGQSAGPTLCYVFRRRSSTERSADLDAATGPAETVDGSHAPGKGRPTPTRKEAEQARKERVRPVLTRRESVRRQREHTRSERARARQAMMSGDERYLSQRDKGPERRFVRDYVDSRRTLAEFFLPMVLVVLVLSLIRSPQIQLLSTLLWMASLLFVIADLAVIAFRVKREVRRRFPDDQRGHRLYAIARATQMRRLRLPKPTVKPGTTV